MNESKQIKWNEEIISGMVKENWKMKRIKDIGGNEKRRRNNIKMK